MLAHPSKVTFFPAWFRAALVVSLLMTSGIAAAPSVAHAQIVVLVNGAPVTALDIDQRMKLTALTTGKTTTRQHALNDLIDDQLKLFIARRYQIEISASDVDNAFDNMARRARVPARQMEQSLTGRGVAIGTLKHKIRADLAWAQLVRGKFGSTLEVGEADINRALQARSTKEDEAVGFIYTMYPILIILPRGANPAAVDLKRREAENLRSRFQNCTEGLKLARALREVVVRDVVRRTSADFPAQVREVLRTMEVGDVTKPEVTAQGIEMFALCDKKQSNADAPIKSELRQELFSQRFEAESKKFLDEVRRQAMIEYK